MAEHGRLFDTVLVVDWSARSTPSPKRPARDAIWWALVRGGAAEPPVYVRTRAEAVARIADILAAERAAGRRTLAGFDFAFGYPAGVAARVAGRASARALWDWIAARVSDGPGNANRRYHAAEEMNAAYDGLGPFWGRPESWPHPGIPVRARDRHGADHPPERRHAEARAPGAKSVWQLAYAGAVGSQVLLGLPALLRLCADPRLSGAIAAWPFDTGFAPPGAAVTLAEIYPSLLSAEVRARLTPGAVPDAVQVATLARALAALDARGGLAAAFAAPTGLDPGALAAAAREEGWILGLGIEEALAAALADADAAARL